MRPTFILLAISCLVSCQTDPLDPKVVERKMIGLQEKFDLIDLDGDGYLTRAEIIAGYEQLGVVNRTPETADTIIGFYDFDKDGRISLREAQSGAVTGADELLRQYHARQVRRSHAPEAR